jgi:putative membrane protein
MVWLWGPGWWFLGSLISLAFWVLVVVAIVHLVRSRPPAPGAPMSSALRILEDRYARGEIGREEFLERRAVLMGGVPPPPPPAPPTGEPTQPL